jgi:hypothetical protein
MTPFYEYPKVELVMVMVLIPLVLNTVVFWVSDNFLMAKTLKEKSES